MILLRVLQNSLHMTSSSVTPVEGSRSVMMLLAGKGEMLLSVVNQRLDLQHKLASDL